MSQTHSYAYLKRVPLLGGDLGNGDTATDAGFAACRIKALSVKPSTLINLQDHNESGQLVGELHDDNQLVLDLTIEVTEGFVFPAIHSKVTLDTDDTFGTQYSKDYQLDEIPADYKPGAAAEVKITLRWNEHMTLAS